LSHQSIYRRIVDEGLPGAIVLEDDAILTPMVSDFLARRGYLEADLVQMIYSWALAYRKKWRELTDRVMLAPLARNAFAAAGYSISARGARYVLRHGVPVSGFADWPCDVTLLRPLATVPQIIRHPPAGLNS